MKKITIREAVTENEVAAFLEQLHAYHKRNNFTDQYSEELEHLLSLEYYDHMMKMYDGSQKGCFFLFFQLNGQDIGFAMPVIFTSEDGKCFIMEYCVYPDFYENDTGRECAKELLNWAKERGALYAELNYGNNEQRRHFWKSVGFVENGVDEWGEPLMLLPPEEYVPITVELLVDPDDWQLKKLENGFLKEIGEAPSTEEKQEQLAQAVRDGKIMFFMAKRGCRAVGMCSVSRCYSTFECTDVGVFDDFYIEPVFRRNGVARKLSRAAQQWCIENGLASLTVTCAPCDEGMYQALGFDAHLGKTFAHLR